MNERIQELLDQIQVNEQIERLAKQAGCTIDRLGYGEGNLEKFAELIVGECAGVIAPMGDWCGGHGEPSMPSTMECAKRLKQHFGVRE